VFYLHGSAQFVTANGNVTTSTTEQIHDEEAPACEHCGGVTDLMGKLPAMGIKRLIKVFRCNGCHRISSTEH
jgi:hypothetical protein